MTGLAHPRQDTRNPGAGRGGDPYQRCLDDVRAGLQAEQVTTRCGQPLATYMLPFVEVGHQHNHAGPERRAGWNLGGASSTVQVPQFAHTARYRRSASINSTRAGRSSASHARCLDCSSSKYTRAPETKSHARRPTVSSHACIGSPAAAAMKISSTMPTIRDFPHAVLGPSGERGPALIVGHAPVDSPYTAWRRRPRSAPLEPHRRSEGRR